MSHDLWHARAAAAALAEQGTASAGLSAAEAARRLASHGPNRLTPPQKRGPLLRFLLQFHNVLIYVLLGAPSSLRPSAIWSIPASSSAWWSSTP